MWGSLVTPLLDQVGWSPSRVGAAALATPMRSIFGQPDAQQMALSTSAGRQTLRAGSARRFAHTPTSWRCSRAARASFASTAPELRLFAGSRRRALENVATLIREKAA
jgi:hypothetical protein